MYITYKSVVVRQKQLEGDEDALAKKEGDLEAREISAKVHAQPHTHTHTYIYMYIYVCMFVCMYGWMDVCMYVCMSD